MIAHFTRGFSLAELLAGAFFTWLAAPLANAADYHIDPAGNDSAAGTSEATAWKSLSKVNATTFQPGDNIRFKRGGVWQGTLSPQGSGNSSAQITLGSYGSGAKPLIEGAGAGAAIAIHSQSYWTIDGFEVTNKAGGSGGNRCGIRVGGGGDGSTIRRIRILNNDVHDIQATPDVNAGARNWGGIFVWIDEPGKADEVLIQNNSVTEIQGQGISFWGEFESAGSGMNYANCSPNVVVRGNRVWRTSGDGILTLGTLNELVEYNEVAYVGVLSGPGNNIAAAWPTRHVDGVWQYNHVHHTKWLDANDSTAFDNDGFVQGTTYFQYNHTHDNEGGFHMEYRWVADTGKTVSRYNISVNDGRGTYARIYFSNRPGSELYNNVFYNPNMTLDVSNGGAGFHTFRNNIFVGSGRTASFDTQGVYFNNTFTGGVTRPVTTSGNRTQDPLFVSPNTTGNLAGFLLQAASPVRSTGQAIANNGGKDFWGAAVPAAPTQPHRGASQINVIDDYTATPTFLRATGPSTVGIPGVGSATATFTAVLRDQNFLPITTASPAWSLVPATAGYSIHPTTGVLTIDSSAAPARFAVVATSGALSSEFPVGSDFAPLVWNNGAATGKWNATDANWTGQAWTNGESALLSHTASAQTVTLEGALVAGGVAIGNGSNNANYTLAGAVGSSLSAQSLTVQGASANDPGLGSAALSNVALNVSGDLGVGRWDFVIGGSSAVTIGGQLRATSDGSGPGDWGRVTIQDNANVTATGGVNGAGTAWGLTLNGGTLTTPSIRAREINYAAGSRLTFNGTTVVASQDNAAFVTVDDTNRAFVGSGGAIFDTNGRTVGIGASLTGNGGLTKQGGGTLTLTGSNSFTGATAVNGGTLSLKAGYASGAHAIAGGAVLDLDVASGSTDFAATTFTGTGTLRKSGGGGAIWGPGAAVFGLGSGALIDIQGGSFTGGSFGNENWSSNLADLHVAGGAAFHGVEANVRIDAISGAGSITSGFVGAGYEKFTLGVDGGSATFSGSFADGNAPAKLAKEGSGTQTFTGSNSYSGGTTILGGTLRASRGALGTGAVVVESGATLEAIDQWVLCSPNPYGVNERNIGTLTVRTGGTLRFDAVSGFANGVANLVLDGGLVTGGPNDFRGDLFLFNGNQQITATGANPSTIASVIGLTGSNTITVEGGGTLNITAGIKNSDWYNNGTTPGGLIKAGAGTLTLSGANSYSSGTAVNGGTLKITGRNQLPGLGGITIASGATLVTDAPNEANTQDISSTITLNGGTLASGAGSPAQNFNSGNPVGPWGNYYLAPGASIQAGNNASSTISASLGVNGSGGYTPIQVDGGSTLHISGSIAGVGFVSWGGFSKSGAGTLVLSGNNKAASQGMILSAGIVEFSTNSLPTNLRAVGGPAGYSADVQGSATLRWAAGNTQDISFENGASQIRIGDGVTATFDTNGNDVTLVSAFDLGAGQSAAVTKSGSGTLTLAAAQSYTGRTTVNAGTLRLGNGSTPTNLANGAHVIVAAGAMLHLDYAGTDQVGALRVDGLQMPPGIYSATSGFITGPGTLTVASGPASANYAAWSGRGIHDLTGGPSDDDDEDGIANVLEYVLGGNPRAASSGILPTASASSGKLVFTFRRLHISTSDTTQVFQHGTDLTGWTDVPVVAGGIVAIQSDTPEVGTDTVTITVPQGAEPRVFGRLQVVGPP